jgi:hypothetical protein
LIEGEEIQTLVFQEDSLFTGLPVYEIERAVAEVLRFVGHPLSGNLSR